MNKKLITRKRVIAEIRRLMKHRIYFVRIWDIYSIEINAEWESDTSISIRIDEIIISLKLKKKISTLKEVQADLSQFKADIYRLCNATDSLAKKAGQDKQDYFEDLLVIAEK